MKGLAITFEGLEKKSAYEVEKIISKKSELGNRILTFEAEEEDLVKLCYLSRSLIKVGIHLHQFKSKNKDDILDEIEKQFSKIKIPYKNKTFRVNCVRNGEHRFSSQDVSQKLGALLNNDSNENNVDLKDPDFIVMVFINENDCVIFIDFSGINLSKREYKIFSHASSLNGGVAAGMLLDIKEKDVIVDPFCGSGTIPIEAAMFLENKSPHYYTKDKFQFLKLHDYDLNKYDKIKGVSPKIFGYDYVLNCITSSRKNAKVSGVDKLITFSKVEVEWLDTKMEKEEVDYIITSPPAMAHAKDNQKKALFKDFFHQVEYVLKKTGKLILFLEKDDILEYKKNFIIKEEYNVMQGQREIHVVVMAKL